LDIVVETGNLGLIFVEDSSGVLETKVLTAYVSDTFEEEIARRSRSQMDVGIRKALAGDLDESLHEVVILFASHTMLS
jgi:hypothetical protein